MKKDLNQIFWVQTILCGLTSAAAFTGHWGAFAAMAFLCVIVPLWIIALGIWANVFEEEALHLMFSDDAEKQEDGE